MTTSEHAHEFPLRAPLRRILVQRPRALGDVLLTTPALRALRASYPHARLDLCVDEVLEPIVRHNPHVDQVWTYPRRGGQRGQGWRLLRALRRVRYDLVLDLHGSPRTAWIAWCSGAPHRVGYALRGRGHLYNFRVPRDTDRNGCRRALYAAQTNLEIVARCGVRGPSLEDTRLVYVGAPDVEAAMEARLGARAAGSRRIGIAPAGTWQAKTYPLESFAAAADRLARHGEVWILWGPGEKPWAEQVLRSMQARARLAPETDLQELAAFLRRLDLLVSNDSGVKHLAVACETPTLTLFGPTNPRAWLPVSGPHVGLRSRVPCLECNLTRCTHHLCMRTLDPDWVLDSALRLLERAPRGAEA